jgi:hypothetical protein
VSSDSVDAGGKEAALRTVQRSVAVEEPPAVPVGLLLAMEEEEKEGGKGEGRRHSRVWVSGWWTASPREARMEGRARMAEGSGTMTVGPSRRSGGVVVAEEDGRREAREVAAGEGDGEGETWTRTSKSAPSVPRPTLILTETGRGSFVSEEWVASAEIRSAS